MLFNSLIFLFGFLPVAVLGYYAVAALRLEWLRLPFVIVMSLVFYGYWTPQYVILLLISTVGNYALGLLVARARTTVEAGGRNRVLRWLVGGGIVANLAALGYYKYANFFVDNIDWLFGTDTGLERILLPLAISFYTFQQISYVIEVGRGTIRPGGFVPYAAFVIFFPQLIAGPIVHFRELVPQLSARVRLDRMGQNILIGLVIFGIGLTKKTVFADTAALYATPVFDLAAAGAAVNAGAAWGASLAYTLQVYFDFSGYSDMAIGLARMFGVLLPINFHSPLRAGSITGLWQKWHITLGRFVRSYVMQPIATPLARWSAGRGHDRRTAHRYSVLLPMFLAMVVIGVWHGAGWNFALFGALHGFFMVINEVWTFRRRQRKAAPLPGWLTGVVDRGGGHVLTVVAFVFAVVPFRAETEAATGRMYAAMAGFGGGGDPVALLWPLGLAGFVVVAAGGLAIVFLLPNTQQIMRRIHPALDWALWQDSDTPPVRFIWRPTPVMMALGGVVLALGVVFILRGSTEFIYFNF